MNLAEWLVRTAQRMPQSPAVLLGSEVQFDYAELTRRAASVGAAMRERYGIEPGDRIAMLLPNCVPYLELMYGAWFAGAAIVPINHKLHPQEAAWILGDCTAKIVFTTKKDAQALNPLLTCDLKPLVVELGASEIASFYEQVSLGRPESRDEVDLAWLFYTSGTTGRPKGAMLSHGNLAAMSLSYLVDVDEVRSTDAALYAAPMSHGAGLYNLMHVLRGARHVIPESESFDANELLKLAPQLGDVSMFAAPTMVRRLVDAAKRIGSTGEGIRTIVYGGGPMYVSDIEEAVEVLGCRFVQIYGQGETPMTITNLPRHYVADRLHPRWRERLGSVGFTNSCIEVRIADEGGCDLPFRVDGEVLVKGPTVMLGYWNNPEATSEAVQDGWLRTGDIGHLDEDGFLTLKDRSKDVIISGGSNIYPREVEEVLLRHPKVREVAVVGRPDLEWGEVVIAYYSGDATAEELDALCLAQIARFKRPKAFVALSALPKNNYGKILKTKLRNIGVPEGAASTREG